MTIIDKGFDDASKWAVSGNRNGGAAIRNSRGEMWIGTGPYRIDVSSQGTISQVVNMPSNYFIKFNYEARDASCFPYYRCRVLVDGTSVWEIAIPQCGYSTGNPTINLSSYIGIHTLSFQMYITASFYANGNAYNYFHVDNIVDSCSNLEVNTTIL